MAACLELIDELDRATLAIFFGRDAGPGVLVHGQRVQRDVWATEGVGRRRQVVGVDLAGHLEHGEGDGLRHFGP